MPNPNNQNNQNENRLSEVKKALGSYEDMLDVLQFADGRLNALHVNFRNALHELSEATDRYYVRDEEGHYPVMDAQAFAQFDALYRNAYRTAAEMETGMQQADPTRLNESDNAWRSVYRSMMDTVREVLGRDLQHLHSVQRHGNETLPALIEEARTHVHDVSGQALETSGAQMSSRIAVTIPGENGAVRGFFTESVTTNLDQEMEALRRETLRKQPALEKVLDNLAFERLGETAPLNVVLSDYAAGGNASLYEWLQIMLPDEEIRQQVIENGAQLTGLLDYMEQRGLLETREKIRNGLGLGENDKVDQRNCAMSTIADLMGMQDLLAHAEPMQIQFTKDGKAQTMTGSFMQFAEGEDIKRQTPGKGLLNLNAPIDTNTTSVKLQMADLQILDYICGNTDRHNANFFYQLDERDPAHPRLTGIQGIDNDSSFTIIAENDQVSHLPAAKSIKAIRSQTAAVVEGLDRDILKTMLRNYNLTEAQLDAVWKRTQILQDEIRTGRDFFRNKQADTLDNAHLRVLDDEAFGRLNLDQLKNSQRPNYFNKLADITKSAVNEYFEGRAKKAREQCMKSLAAFNDGIGKIHDQVKALNKANRFFRTKAEYGMVLYTAEALDKFEPTDMLTISEDEVKRRLPFVKSALRAANDYLAYKQDEYDKEMAKLQQKYNTAGMDEKTQAKTTAKMNKAMDKVREKYNGRDSADAKRIRAVMELQQNLSKSLEAGNKVLLETRRYDYFSGIKQENQLEELRVHFPQYVPAPENQQNAQEIQQPAPENPQNVQENRDRPGRKLSAADLQEQMGLQVPNNSRRSVPQKPAQQKEMKRSNSMQS